MADWKEVSAGIVADYSGGTVVAENVDESLPANAATGSVGPDSIRDSVHDTEQATAVPLLSEKTREQKDDEESKLGNREPKSISATTQEIYVDKNEPDIDFKAITGSERTAKCTPHTEPNGFAGTERDIETGDGCDVNFEGTKWHDPWRTATSPIALAILRQQRRRDVKYYRRKLALRLTAMLLLLAAVFGIVYAVVAVDWHAEGGPVHLLHTDPLPHEPIMTQGQGSHVGSESRSQPHLLGIMHGTDAKPGEYPWMVDLVEVETGRSKCGGSLITPSWVLTAAHCVITMLPADLSVVIGEHDVKKKDEFEQKRKIRQFVIEPEFSMLAALPNDMALLELDEPAQLSDRVAVVPVTRADSKLTECTVAGWGAAGVDPYTGQPIYPSTLQHVPMRRLRQPTCEQRLVGYKLTPNMTCAEGDDGAAVCWGDSGGSLSCRPPAGAAAAPPADADGARVDGAAPAGDAGGARVEGAVRGAAAGWTLVGITSWGVACGYLQYPSVYTRVSKFVPWLQNVTGVEVKEDA